MISTVWGDMKEIYDKSNDFLYPTLNWRSTYQPVDCWLVGTYLRHLNSSLLPLTLILLITEVGHRSYQVVYHLILLITLLHGIGMQNESKSIEW